VLLIEGIEGLTEEDSRLSDQGIKKAQIVAEVKLRIGLYASVARRLGWSDYSTACDQALNPILVCLVSTPLEYFQHYKAGQHHLFRALDGQPRDGSWKPPQHVDHHVSVEQ